MPLTTRSACFGLNPGQCGNGVTAGLTAPPVHPAGACRSSVVTTAARAAAWPLFVRCTFGRSPAAPAGTAVTTARSRPAASARAVRRVLGLFQFTLIRIGSAALSLEAPRQGRPSCGRSDPGDSSLRRGGQLVRRHRQRDIEAPAGRADRQHVERAQGAQGLDRLGADLAAEHDAGNAGVAARGEHPGDRLAARALAVDRALRREAERRARRAGRAARRARSRHRSPSANPRRARRAQHRARPRRPLPGAARCRRRTPVRGVRARDRTA